MSKGEHELVGSWQYVKSAVAIYWDDLAPFAQQVRGAHHNDSAAQDEENNNPKVTLNDEYKIYDVTVPIEWDAGVAITPMIYSRLQWESRMTHYACYYAASALLVANSFATKSQDGVKQTTLVW